MSEIEDWTKSWAKVVKEYPEANFLQSPAYGKMNELLGEKVIEEDFGGRGRALMIVRAAKRGRYLEIPCGPLMDWGDKMLVREVFAHIAEIAEQEKCVFVRVRPQLVASAENMKRLADLGLKKSPMHLAAEHTVMIDLGLTEEKLLAGMRRQTRYEVRRAAKFGITVTCDDTEELFREFHRVQLETARRQGFVPPSLKVLLAEREAFRGRIWIYVARTDKCAGENESVQDEAKTARSKMPTTEASEPIAYGLIINDGHEGDYYEAASTDLNRKLPGAYALLWQAMRDLKAEGVERFNLWGIAPAGQPGHRYAGVTTFKTGFGGAIVEYVPAHDMVISKVGYWKDLIVEKARKKRRHL
ncbi:peptidoglycan bridge formation glycyltransferase FemA/FemB family protein [Candidatus Saccharibacteria bacterium]|nr:peptidoglycan bridge formation glycyltransferase FemA/FemB family protein [Candidatus Saccharibacteria bacterium]